jgi:Fe2+ or Zn2+ uptake regulation protein
LTELQSVLEELQGNHLKYLKERTTDEKFSSTRNWVQGRIIDLEESCRSLPPAQLLLEDVILSDDESPQAQQVYRTLHSAMKLGTIASLELTQNMLVIDELEREVGSAAKEYRLDLESVGHLLGQHSNLIEETRRY